MGPAFTTFVQPRARRLNRWRSIARIARAVAIAVVAVAAAYLVGANALLSTGWFARIVNEYPDTIDVHYAKGWTVWPGRVHARDLSVRAADSNVEWILRIDEVTFDVSLWGLLHRRFFADRVRGSGVSLRIRQRLDTVPKSRAEVEDLPPIGGFPPYALRPKIDDPFSDWDDAYWDLWTIRLRDVVAEHTREVWIDHTRFVGDARVTGGFYLKPVREAQIGPVHGEIAEGRVTRGERSVIAATLGGAFDVTVDEFDPRVTFGKQILRRVSGHALASSDLWSPVGALVTARVSVKDGRVEDGSRLEAFVPRVHLPVGNMDARGSLELRAEARGDDLYVDAESGRTLLEVDDRFVAQGDVRLSARVRGLDLLQSRQNLDVSGSRLTVAHATLAEHARIEQQWGGELAVDHARLRLDPSGFEGRLRLGASDTLPLFATLFHDKAPRIVESMLAMPRLQGLAWVTAAPDSFAVRDLVVRGADVWIRGAYGQIGDDRLGAFVVDKGPLSAGIAIDDDGVHPHLFWLDAWLATQEMAINRWLEEPARPPAAREQGVRGPRSSP